MSPHLILIEGLPGSGKSTLAEWLCEDINAKGSSAVWIPELERDHPIVDQPTMRTAKIPGYADRCIERWSRFSTGIQKLDAPSTIILEACLFQSTVRLLVEYEHCVHEIEGYLPAVEAWLAPHHVQLVYLIQTNATDYLETELIRRKGFETVSRIASYSESTPYSTTRGLQGFAALKSLYTDYRNVCDSLVRNTKLPVLEVDVTQRSETEVRQHVSQWLFQPNPS